MCLRKRLLFPEQTKTNSFTLQYHNKNATRDNNSNYFMVLE